MMNRYIGFGLLLCLACQVNAITFHVNILTDGVDSNPGDGVCEMTAGTGDCSLRAATNEANALGGTHVINLGAGVHGLTLVGEESVGLAGDLNIYGAAVTISGQSATTTIIDGNTLSTVMEAINNDIFILENVTITGGRADTATEFIGGGLVIAGASTVATLRSVAILDNVANAGGGIFIVNADVTIDNSLIQGNAAEFLGFTNQFGPAIYNKSGTLTINASTVTENEPGTKAIEIEAGEIYMTNTTVSNNEGGGLRTTESNGIVRASTFFNTVGQNISHYSFDHSHVLNVGSSILTTGPSQPTDNCQSGDLPNSLGHNIVNDSSCAFTATGDQQNATAIIDVLADNGGMWPTHLPSFGSLAIDAVDSINCLDAFSNILLVDQRGMSRPYGVACDAGSVEQSLDVIFKNGFE